MGYYTAKADEYLCITGKGIKNLRIVKSAWVWPFQRVSRFSVQPHDYAMDMQAMTKEKLQFRLPVVFTIGPDVNARGANGNGSARHPGAVEDHVDDECRGDALVKYAMLLADSKARKRGGEVKAHCLAEIVTGIIEGETRVLISSMTMEEIFSGRDEFKRRIFRNVRTELVQFGLKIYNANIKELRDAPGGSYFQSLSQKAHMGATNQARIDVAEAQYRGNVGEAQRQAQQDRDLAMINAETAVAKTSREVERAAAEASLRTQQNTLDRDVEISRIQAARATQSADEELKKLVAVKRAAAELERLRATDVVKATILRESKQQAADARAYEVMTEAKAEQERLNRVADAAAYKTRIDAEADAYEQKIEAQARFERKNQEADAEAHRIRVQSEASAYEQAADAQVQLDRQNKNTDADAYRTRTGAEADAHAALRKAETDLQRRLKEAEGLAAMADAYGRLSKAFGGPNGLLQYLMIERGTYLELARANAAAVQGLQPRISVWNTGTADPVSGGPLAADASSAAVRNLYQMLPPLVTTIHEQTGLSLPEWQFGHLAAEVTKGAGVRG